MDSCLPDSRDNCVLLRLTTLTDARASFLVAVSLSRYSANGLDLNTTDPMRKCMPRPPPPPATIPTSAPTFFWEALDEGFTSAPTEPQTPAPTADFQLINAVYVELSWDIRLNGIPLPPISGMIMASYPEHRLPNSSAPRAAR
jgi:hypothetical protein